MVLTGEAEMQLADRDHRMVEVAQLVVPAWNGAVVGVGVVPVTHLVDVLADRERGARRNAHRAGAIGRAEARATSGQPVEMGSLDERMSVAAQGFRAVLVGHDDEQIAGWNVHTGRVPEPRVEQGEPTAPCQIAI